MPIVDSIDFSQFNDGQGSYGRPTGLAYSDSLNTWRRKTNGIINYVDGLTPFIDFLGSGDDVGKRGLQILTQDDGDRKAGSLVFTGKVTINGSLLFSDISANTILGIPIGEGTEESPAHDSVLVYNANKNQAALPPGQFDIALKPQSFQGPFIDLGATFDASGNDSSEFDNEDSQADRTAVQEIYIRNNGRSREDIIIFAEGPYYGENGIISLCATHEYRIPGVIGKHQDENDDTIYYKSSLHVLQNTRVQGWNNRGHYGNFQLVGRVTVPLGVSEISVRIISYSDDWNPAETGTPWTEDANHYFMGDNPVRFMLYSSDDIEQIARPE